MVQRRAESRAVSTLAHEAHSPLIWLWLLAPLWFRRAPARTRTFGWITYGFAAAVFVAYLPYVYFRPDEWSYTRFLLPACR